MSLREDFANLRVLVIGDAMLDVFETGTSSRSCPEAHDAPVIDQPQRTEFPGGAANVAANVEALGANVTLISQASLIEKRRIVSNGRIVARVDARPLPISSFGESCLIAEITAAWNKADLVVISDYGYGVMTDAVIDAIARLRARNAPYGKWLVIDAKDLRKYRYCNPSAVCPNWRQFQELIEFPSIAPEPANRRQWVADLALHALNRANAPVMAVTLDAEGTMTLSRTSRPAFVEARPIEPAHPSGAGDTFTAAFALCLATGRNRYEAGEVAQRAAEVACRDPFTHATAIGELEQALGQPSEPTRPRTVLATGVFDVLHRGHIDLLKAARKLGDRLVVAINSDESVRRLKGEGRPVNTLADRMRVLAALRCVDQVSHFDADEPTAYIEAMRPDIYVRGGDYFDKPMPEASTVNRYGGRVVILPRLEGYSSTESIERLNNGKSTSPSEAALAERQAAQRREDIEAILANNPDIAPSQLDKASDALIDHWGRDYRKGVFR